MFRRTTAILGAGAVLDFHFNGIEEPTTSNITRICTEQKVQGLDVEEIDLISCIYSKIVDAVKSEYIRLHPTVRNYEPNITFEDLFEVIETLYSYNATWKHEHYPISLISALIKSDIHFESVEYLRALIAIVETIVHIVNAYDQYFRGDDCELWYKHFWRNFNGLIDIFNFNYDTTIERSLETYNDGFIGCTQKYERFDPEFLWKADYDTPTVNHLHGCILYADVNSKPVEYYYNHRDLYKLYAIEDVLSLLGYQWPPHNQVKDTIFYTPIITGLKKADKICYLPHSIYHANLVKKIIENPSLLICGYSFGDLYANQILERHKLIHDKNQRVVIVEKWPSYSNDNSVNLYRYYMDHTSSGLKEFVSRVIEGGIAPLNTFKHFLQVSDECWESPNGILRIYTNGLKSAVLNHQYDILDYLGMFS